MNATELALDGLATYRLQRLIGRDRITEGPRERALSALWTLSPGAASKLDDLVGCPWCRSGWAALAVLGLSSFRAGRLVRNWLALWGAASLLAAALDPEDLLEARTGHHLYPAEGAMPQPSQSPQPGMGPNPRGGW